MSELSDKIKENAEGPRKVETDNTSAEQHSLSDQIKADKHLSSVSAGTTPHRGLRFNKITPPGAC
jgi:hypothetical protein